MSSPNHIAGGLAFTGIFASFWDVNIFASPLQVGLVVFFSLLPDIDHTKSPVGKLFFPLAQWLDRHYGHRTLTHSLLCWLAVSLAAGLIFKLLDFSFGGWGACLSYLSHLIFDMCTQAGIPFFYPFSSARCVIPGNAAMRLPSGNTKIETFVFLGFNALTLTCFPLMQNGFWMSYNNYFKTFSHLQSEFRRSPAGLEVDYQTKGGNTRTGFVMAAQSNQAVVFLPAIHADSTLRGSPLQGTFQSLHEEDTRLLAFRQPGQLFKQERVVFTDISEDSLRQLLQKPILMLSITCNHPLHYSQNSELKTGTTVRLDYISDFHFSVVLPDSTALLYQIRQQKALIEAEQSRYKQAQDSLYNVQQQIRRLRKTYPRLSDYEKGKATEKLRKLRDWQEHFHPPQSQTSALQKELDFLQAQHQPPPLLSGTVLQLSVNSKQ
jgi:inner membrane protein